MAENKPELQRGLEARHIELIALGGTIGVGRGQYAEVGRTFGSAGVYRRWAVRIFHYAFYGGDVIPRAGCRFIRCLRSPLYEPLLWLSHRLVILVYVDGGGDLRDYRHRGVRPVLVPGNGAMDTRTDRGRTGCIGEPRRSSLVW